MSVNNNLQTGSGRIRVARFTASGSWVAPAGVYSVKALAVGGGGGGGASRNSSSGQAVYGGGGGGGGVVDQFYPVVPATTYTVTIGTGGAGGNTTAAGSNGTDTTFGSVFTAPGGQGGVSYLLGTSYAPSTNPGGSQGGWGRVAGSTEMAMPGHGCGAATPIFLASNKNVLGIGDMVTTVPLTFFDGVSNVTIPVLQFYETTGESNANIYSAPDTATTFYQGVKRTAYLGNITDNVAFIPGHPWNGLGGGGASVLTDSTANNTTRFLGRHLTDTRAGRVYVAYNISTSNSGNASGTNAVANSGAGGGGSYCGGTNNTIASGGNGGSGYVEIVWQE